MPKSADRLVLTNDELAFFRLTCDLFPTPESPLRRVAEEHDEPIDPERVFLSLSNGNRLNENGSGASREVLDRVVPVSECEARVCIEVHGDTSTTRDFYLREGSAVEYERQVDGHAFGPLRNETGLAAELASSFRAAQTAALPTLRMSPGDHLVFAVFARDLRAAPEPPPEDDAMSIEEVLAYFDEPETKVVRTPSDESWQSSVDTLLEQGVLIERADGHQLHPRWHPLAREIVADRQHVITRFDFLDEQWLVREVSLYPTSEAVYRVDTEADGSVVIEELSAAGVADVIANVVRTLPNLLNPDVPPTLKHPLFGSASAGR